MKTLKITRGEFSTLGNGVIKEMGGKDFSWICANVTDAFDDNPKDNKAKYNAEFIAEAFNVANETGLTPQQLLEQRNELLREIESVIVTMQKWSGGLHQPVLDQLNRIIEIHKS